LLSQKAATIVVKRDGGHPRQGRRGNAEATQKRCPRWTSKGREVQASVFSLCVLDEGAM
jgi:hypothetical protein